MQNFGGYQLEATKLAIYPNQGDNLPYVVLGLCGEAGEIADKVKKILRDDDGKLSYEKREALLAELGDVLWYVSQIAQELGEELGDVAERNLKKLWDRRDRNQLGGSGDTR